jgi:hypothetical protein
MSKPKLLLAVICSLFSATLAAADPISVTGGQLLMVKQTGALDITGEQGFSLTANVHADFGVFGPRLQCGFSPGCAPGTLVSLRGFWSDSDVRGVLTFEGETYPVGGGLFNDASVTVEFEGSFVTPPLAPSAVITAPFTLVPFTIAMGGSAFTLPPSAGDGRYPIAGSGITTINLRSGGAAFPGVWVIESVRYDFSAGEPVPEPGTLLLVGLGIAGAARRVTRARARA